MPVASWGGGLRRERHRESASRLLGAQTAAREETLLTVALSHVSRLLWWARRPRTPHRHDPIRRIYDGAQHPGPQRARHRPGGLVRWVADGRGRAQMAPGLRTREAQEALFSRNQRPIVKRVTLAS